jgi:hypothetical protein
MLSQHQAMMSLLVVCLLAAACSANAANKTEHATIADALKDVNLTILQAAVQVILHGPPQPAAHLASKTFLGKTICMHLMHKQAHQFS